MRSAIVILDTSIIGSVKAIGGKCIHAFFLCNISIYAFTYGINLHLCKIYTNILYNNLFVNAIPF